MMRNEFSFICAEVWKGKSILRAYLNFALKDVELKGSTIDIGGGGGSNYISFVKRAADVSFETFDLKVGKQIDFETDELPAASDSYDTVLFLNVMEHIFNYQHIANEVVRITKPGGQLIGFVPFLMWYHPDHRDFFRYTHEALEIIFARTGAKDIKITPVARGPFTAASHIVLLSFPKLVRVPLFAGIFLLDRLFLRFKKQSGSRYVLGYLFTMTK